MDYCILFTDTGQLCFRPLEQNILGIESVVWATVTAGSGLHGWCGNVWEG